jgi:hypothetical protein
MQILHKRFSVVLGLGLLIILLAAIALITKRQLDVQISDQVWV